MEKEMRPNVWMALILASGLITLSYKLDGGSLGLLYQPTSLLIVFGGITCGLIMQFSLGDIRLTLSDISTSRSHGHKTRLVPKQIYTWAKKVRQDGIRVLEDDLETIKDPVLKRAVYVAVENGSSASTVEILSAERQNLSDRLLTAPQVLEAAGNYAPTMGMIGSILGLIHLMQNLQDPSNMGPGIATAFVSTLYGGVLANLVIMPLANRLSKYHNEILSQFDLVSNAMIGILEQRNPLVIQEAISIRQSKTVNVLNNQTESDQDSFE